MSIYTRPDSPYWWLFLETTKTKANTKIRIGTTRTEKYDNKRSPRRFTTSGCGDRARAESDHDSADHVRRLGDDLRCDQIATHKGRVRERQILPRLRAAFGNCCSRRSIKMPC